MKKLGQTMNVQVKLKNLHHLMENFFWFPIVTSVESKFFPVRIDPFQKGMDVQKIKKEVPQVVSLVTLLLLNTTCPVLANSVDPDQLASEKANWFQKPTDLDLHCLSLICEFLSKTRIK